MTRGVRVAAAGTAMVASVVVLQGSLASASPDTSGRGHDRDAVLEFDVLFSPPDYTDLAEPGPSPADLITFNDVLLVDGVQVGHEVGSCVLVDASGLANCTAVITRDGEGTIAFAFENAPPPTKVLALTGGSGGFKGVDGDGVLVEHGNGTGSLTLSLD